MNRRRDTTLGDLLRAFKRLHPTDDADRAAIAELLGIGWNPYHESEQSQTASPDSPSESPHPEDSEEDPGPAIQPDPTMPSISEGRNYPPLIALDQGEIQEESSTLEPTWLVETNALPHSAEEKNAGNRPEPRPIEPLLEPVQTRALLSDILASEVADGPVDVRTLEAHICRLEPVLELPRFKRRSLSRGIEVLVDRSPSLTPFFSDQIALLRRIQRLVGKQNLKVLLFESSPLKGAGGRKKRTWTPWTPPSTKRPVLVLTDLGILDAVKSLQTDPTAVSNPDWARFAKLAADAECSVVALVPYPRHRWPSETEDLFPTLPWDRELSHKDLRQALGRRWKVTG